MVDCWLTIVVTIGIGSGAGSACAGGADPPTAVVAPTTNPMATNTTSRPRPRRIPAPLRSRIVPVPPTQRPSLAGSVGGVKAFGSIPHPATSRLIRSPRPGSALLGSSPADIRPDTSPAGNAANASCKHFACSAVAPPGTDAAIDAANLGANTASFTQSDEIAATSDHRGDPGPAAAAPARSRSADNRVCTHAATSGDAPDDKVAARSLTCASEAGATVEGSEARPEVTPTPGGGMPADADSDGRVVVEGVAEGEPEQAVHKTATTTTHAAPATWRTRPRNPTPER